MACLGILVLLDDCLGRKPLVGCLKLLNTETRKRVKGLLCMGNLLGRGLKERVLLLVAVKIYWCVYSEFITQVVLRRFFFGSGA